MDEDDINPGDEDMAVLLELEANELAKVKVKPMAGSNAVKGSPFPVKQLSFEEEDNAERFGDEHTQLKKRRLSGQVEGLNAAAVTEQCTKWSTEDMRRRSEILKQGQLQPTSGDYIYVSDSDGNFAYVSFGGGGEDDDCDLGVCRDLERRKVAGFLSHPIEELLEQVHETRFRKQQWIQPIRVENKPEVGESGGGELWVDKFGPHSFHELLSDSGVNLEVLKWLKEWDSFVFPSNKGASNKGRKRNQVKEHSENLDTRPLEKIILLSGGPGVGKSTLAHIAARHAGYFPVEINASMERTETQLREHVLNATGQQATIATNRNPKALPPCLIIDEIDGVAGSKEHRGAIDLLVKMALAKLKSSEPGQSTATSPSHDGGDMDSDKDNEPGHGDPEAEDQARHKLAKRARTAGKGAHPRKSTSSSSDPMGGAITPVLRPVICICNNPWTTTLKELKKVAKTFVVPEVDSKRMFNRLLHICHSENVSYSKPALVDLCQLSQGDIRCCLNTLQFLKSKNREISSASIHDSQIGMKDQVKALFPIWASLFHRLDNQKYQKLLYGDQQSVHKPSKSSVTTYLQYQRSQDEGFQYVLRSVTEHSEQEKLWEGCFENIHSVKYSDSSGTKTWKCLDWFAWMDRLDSVAFQQQAYALKKYLPFGIAQTFVQCSSIYNPPRLEYPRKFQALAQELSYHSDLLASYLYGLLAPRQAFLTPRVLLLDVLSYLLPILNPKLTVNTSNIAILSTKDRNDLRELSQKYVDYNVGFAMKPQPNQPPAWEYDNSIDQLVTFSGLELGYTPLHPRIRELLYQKIQYEKVQRVTEHLTGSSGERSVSPLSQTGKSERRFFY